MKILKLELQNINSLKCETPITIDFTSEAFQNIGLFAITGPTGAGKTTILDAISIALYRQVPRFNINASKAGLEDIVSYGAGEAFARLTFVNKEIVYEAFWTIRIKTKSGKPINPKEEVRLYNITTGEIIAEKKTEFRDKIEEIIQLNYDQFLRSVLLAQGEFAAFLSAKNTDKGQLLEQITGEQIYKKIGESVSDRKSVEVRTLMEIKSRINAEDLLTKDQHNELKTESSEIDNSIKNIKEKSKFFTDILSWFKKQDELQLTENILKESKEKLDLDIEENKPKIIALENNEKAENFRIIISEIKRIDTDILKNETNLLKAISDENIIKTDLLKSDKILENASQNNKYANDEFNVWQPKIIKISELEIESNSLNTQVNAESNTKIEVSNSVDIKNSKLLLSKEILSKTEKEITKIDVFLESNKLVPEISKYINKWSIGLHERLSSSRNIENAIIKKSEVERLNFNINRELESTGSFLKNLENSIEKNSVKLERINKFLEKNSLNSIHDNKQKFGDKYKDLEILKASVLQKEEFQKKQDILSSKLAEILFKIKENSNDLERKEELLKKEEENLALKQQIVNLHQERSKLEQGCACPLCGSENHPAVEEYKSVSVDDSQSKITNLKLEIKSLSFSDINLKKEEIENNSSIANANKLLRELSSTIEELLNKYNIESIDIVEIEALMESSKAKVLAYRKLITKVDYASTKKDEISIKITDDTSDLNNSNKEIAVFIAKKSANSSKLVEYGDVINDNDAKLKTISQELSMEFMNVLLEVPEIKDTDTFIKDLQSNIETYLLNNEKSTKLKNTKSNIEIEIKSLSKVIEEEGNRLVQIDKQINKLSEQISRKTSERADILPIEITAKSKSNSLSLEKENSQNALNKATTENQLNLDKQIVNTSEINSISKLALELNKEITEQNSNFEIQLEFSGFYTKEEIQNALLSLNDKDLFLKLKKELDAEIIKINHSEQLLEKEIITHNSAKTFEESKQDAELNIQSFGEEEKGFNERIGEIRQKFESDKSLRAKNKDITKEADSQQSIVTKWDNLLKLLGGTKDSFNVYVQRLTLQNLIHRANLHLLKLNDRYSLQLNKTYAKGEELNFKLIDHYQTNQERYVDTSSGGEKFIISLALALGLSDLASNNVQINSLFIDEGFGTLDNNTLETVISTLETLQSQGKIIGVISHVESLKERISTQIQVQKMSNGISKVELVY